MEFKCQTCGACFTTGRSLQRHVGAQHLNVKHLCSYCQRSFNYVSDKTRHERTCFEKTQQENDAHKHLVETLYSCQQCSKSFKGKWYLDVHIKAQHMDVTHPCKVCGKTFKYAWNCSKHSKTCGTEKETYSCTQCSKELATRGALNSHEKSHEKQREETTNRKRKCETRTTAIGSNVKQRKTEVHCTQCHQTFPNRHEHYLHRMRQHFQTGSGTTLQQPPWDNEPVPFENNAQLREVYDANRPLILANHQESSVETIFNFPISNDFTVDSIMSHANYIYDRQQSAFRLNLEFGLILVNPETGEYRYFTPYSNEALFDRPIYVSRRQDIRRLRLRLERLNITDYVLRQRPDTKWKPSLITNVRFTVYSLNHALGIVNVKLPDHVKNSKSIIALDKTSEGKFYKDHLCAFRCLATHQGHQRDRLETHTKALLGQWVQYMQEKCPNTTISLDPRGFKGVQLSQLVYFEKCFGIMSMSFVYRKISLPCPSTNLNVISKTLCT